MSKWLNTIRINSELQLSLYIYIHSYTWTYIYIYIYTSRKINLLYARYTDDLFLVVENEQDIQDLKVRMENNSTLKFTHEIG